MCVHIYVGDAITSENAEQNNFPDVFKVTISISILLFIILLCIFSCLFCFLYNRLRHKRNSVNSCIDMTIKNFSYYNRDFDNLELTDSLLSWCLSS